MACIHYIFPVYFQMGKFKGSKGHRSNDDQAGEDALHRVLANGYTSDMDRGLPGRQGRKKAGPAGRSNTLNFVD